jgi:hypothetical protein
MDLNELGAIGELIGGVGVIVTFLYLAIQIRQNTQQLKFTSSTALWEGLSTAYDPAYIGNNMGIFRKRLAGEPLDPEENMTFLYIAFRTMSHFQQIYSSYQQGYIDKLVLDMNRGVLLSHLGAPGMRDYWRTWGAGIGFTQAFVAWVEEIYHEAKDTPVDQRFWESRKKVS